MGGGDKALLKIGGSTILERVLARLTRIARPSCSTPMAIRRVSRLRSSRRCRRRAGFRRAACRHSRRPRLGRARSTRIEWIASVPGDCPFLPRDLVPRLHEARCAAGHTARLRHVGRMASPGSRRSGRWRCAPTCAAPCSTKDLHKIEVFTGRYGVALAEWPDRAGRSVLQRQHARGPGRGRAILQRNTRMSERLILRRSLP